MSGNATSDSGVLVSLASVSKVSLLARPVATTSRALRPVTSGPSSRSAKDDASVEIVSLHDSIRVNSVETEEVEDLLVERE